MAPPSVRPRVRSIGRSWDREDERNSLVNRLLGAEDREDGGAIKNKIHKRPAVFLEVQMSRRARRLGGALSLLALLSLVAAALASAGSPPGTPISGTSPGKIRKVGQSNPN